MTAALRLVHPSPQGQGDEDSGATAAQNHQSPRPVSNAATYAPGPSGEGWLPVVGFEKTHEVSSYGRVRSISRVAERRYASGAISRPVIPGKLLKPTPDHRNYGGGRLCVNLKVGGSGQNFRVHRIVAAAFIGPCPDGMEVAHNNGIASDNRLENLRYATPAENTADKWQHGTMMCGEAVPSSKLAACQVQEIRRLRAQGVKLEAIKDQFGISIAQVSRIANSKRWKHLNGDEA